MRAPMPRINLSRRSRILIAVVVALFVLMTVLSSLTGVYVNWLWFKSLGFRGVYSTVLWTRVVLFLLFGVFMTLVVVGNVVLAYRLRPAYRPMSPEQQNLERYRLSVEPYKRLILIGLTVLAFFGAGMAGQSQWQVWQLFLHGGSFGVRDPQFHKDISFYAWDYPAYRAALGLGITAVIFAFLLSLGMHYFTGSIRLQTPGQKVSATARRHLTLLAFFFIVFKALSYWLDRYGLVFSDRSTFTGASYTDVHASLPSKTILFWIAILLAVGLIASLWLNSSLVPGVGFVSMLVLSILISGIYPAILQQVSVKPNASSKEVPYIERSIDATRAAYGIQSGTDVSYVNYAKAAEPANTAMTLQNPTVANARILDPNVVSQAFARFQQDGNVYGFPAKLDVDRYTIGDKTQDYVVSIRELDQANLTGSQTNWINQHTNYTHGYGFVAAAATSDVTNDGNIPGAFAAGYIPPSGSIKVSQPEVYYGELLPNYSIVGAEGSPQEYNGDGTSKVTYTGGGGVSLSNVLTRLAFAVKYKQTNFLLNDAASAKGAKIVFNRDPREMLQKAAPFLKVDGDPYPIVDSSTGHIVWMVDGYTTMNNYPYSQRNSLSKLTDDSLTASDRTASQPNDSINYIRNSVKATVDAYTGKVTLYAWDKSNPDPVLRAWMKVFPGLVKPQADMPTAISEHVRYPQDLFEVQRSLIGTYHVDSPVTFYNVGDKWTVPDDKTSDVGGAQPPYYVQATAPGTSAGATSFQLTSAMNVNNTSYLAAYISVDCDPSSYGKFTVLKVPKGTSVIQGPEQVASRIRANGTITQDLSLFNTAGGGSSVIHGNLLTLPVGNSFAYVEPLYTTSTGGTGGYPQLQRVIVVYGDKIGYSTTLALALTDFLPGHTTGQTLPKNGGASSGGNTGTGSTSPTPTPTTSSGSTPPTNQTLQQLVQQLDQAYAALTAAYQSGDPSKISAAQGVVLDLVRQLSALQAASSAPAPSSSPAATSPKPSPTPSSSR